MLPVEQLYEEIGSLIRVKREKLEMSQAELGKKLGLSLAWVSHVESGQQRIRIDQFCQIVETLRCQPGDLLDSVLHNTSMRNINEPDLASLPKVSKFVKSTVQDKSVLDK